MTGVELRDVELHRDGRAVLAGVSLQVASAASVAITGASGAGKTTLLDVACGLLVPDVGTVTVDGHVISSLDERRRSAWRLRSCGVVFQYAELFPELTLQENVGLPLRLMGTAGRVADARAHGLLGQLGLAPLAGRRPSQVSGGERQRAGIARALVAEPRLVLADEPTGSLDPAMATSAASWLRERVLERGASLLVVTHNQDVAAVMDDHLHLSGGSLDQRVQRA